MQMGCLLDIVGKLVDFCEVGSGTVTFHKASAGGVYVISTGGSTHLQGAQRRSKCGEPQRRNGVRRSQI
jgi:hypothetical protein